MDINQKKQKNNKKKNKKNRGSRPDSLGAGFVFFVFFLFFLVYVHCFEGSDRKPKEAEAADRTILVQVLFYFFLVCVHFWNTAREQKADVCSRSFECIWVIFIKFTTPPPMSRPSVFIVDGFRWIFLARITLLGEFLIV